MKISAYNQEPEDVLVQTLFVHKNPLNPLSAYLVHCPYCSEKVTQVQGVIDEIMVGLQPTDDVVVINKGYHCKLKYVVQTSYSTSEWTKVTINKFQMPDYLDGEVFRCYICRTPVLDFRGPLDLPLSLICKNGKCFGKYFIKDLI